MGTADGGTGEIDSVWAEDEDEEDSSLARKGGKGRNAGGEVDHGLQAKESSVFNRLSNVEETVFIHLLFTLDYVCAGLLFGISVMPV